MTPTYNDNYDKILADYRNICDENERLNHEDEKFIQKINQRIEVCDETERVLDDATTEFDKLTSIINKKDIPFFVFSVVLQGGVKYFEKYLRDLSDKELADKTPGHKKEHSDRLGYKYYASREEIISNPVPFDAIRKEHTNEWYKIFKIEKPGFSGLNHRTKALGHDPLLGLIFGTANIMTSTITRNDFVSWHVDTRDHWGTAKNGSKYFMNLDTICDRASTIDIFSHIAERLDREGTEGWVTLGCALLKEIVHLFSDIPSKQSLPFPLISVFDEKLARTLSFYGLNTGTIAQGAVATKVINWLIAFLHGLARGKNENERLYQARTRKIIMYSDLFATASDLAYSLFLAYSGDKNTMRKFDLGGYLVTLYQITHSSKVISEIEREFYVKKMIDKFNNK